MGVETVASVDGIELEATVQETDGGAARGVVVFAHGLGSSMDANKFGRLADRLAESGFNSVRFSFRGHGRSAGTRRGMTIAGELLDFEAIVEFATERFSGPLSVVAASFGSVATCLSLPWLGDRLAKLALWYPVLDLRRTFLSPETPIGRQLFSPQQQKLLDTNGVQLLDGQEMGRVLFMEFERYDVLADFAASHVPTLIVHGDQDRRVPYRISEEAVRRRPDTATLYTVPGADHRFDIGADDAIATTHDWLTS